MTPPLPGTATRSLALRVAVVAGVFWVVDLALLRGGTPHPLDDTWEYGLVARSLLEGHGFRIPMIHPPLWGLRDASLTVPVLVHGPLLPLIAAVPLAIFGAAALDHAAWLAATFAVLAAVFTARVVARTAGAASGAMAAALVTGSPTLVRMVHHDIASAAGAWVVALLLDLITRPRPPAFVIGLVVGAGALVRPELVLTAPIAAYALGRASWVPLLLGSALVVAPWFAHGLAATGSPGFNLSSYLLIAYTTQYPGLSPLWDFTLTPARWPAAFTASLPSLPSKWLYFAPRAVRHLLFAPAPWFGVLSALGAIAAWRSPETRRFALAAMGAAMIPFVLCVTAESSERYVAVFLPLWAVGAVRGVDALAGVRGRWGRIALAGLFLPFTLIALSGESRRSAALRDWLAAERVALASRATDDLGGRLLFSDAPSLAAWTTGRPTIASTVESYGAVAAETGEARGLSPRGTADDEWFHADLRALPPTRGGSAAEASGR